MRTPPRQAARAALVAVLAAILAATAAACPRPPVGPPGDDGPGDGRVGPIALETFTQDRPAIAGKWFLYEPDGHTLTPKPQAWVVRDTSAGAGEDDVRYAAVRIADIYESETADSGRFTLGVALFDAATATWGAEQTWVTPRNVKLTGQMCVDVFAQRELPCDDEEPWQLRLAIFQYLSPLAHIAVAEPGAFVHDRVARVARVDDVDDLVALAAAVPDPAALPALDDAPPPTWDGTDWAFDRYAPDLPEAGMAIGARFADGPDDVYWLMTARFDLVRFTVAPAGDALRFTYAVVAVERDDASAPTPMPAPVVVDVPLPPTGGTWLTFTTPDLAVEAEHLADTSWPHAPPKTTRFDLAIARAPDGRAQVLLSQGTAVINATQLGLDEDLPPVSTP